MKKRVISAIVALAIVIPVLILGRIPFYAGVGILAILGFKELIELREKEKKFPLLIKILSLASLIVLVLYRCNTCTESLFIDYRMFLGMVFVNIIPLLIFQDEKKYNINDALYLIGVIIFLWLGFYSIIVVRNLGLNYIVYLLLISFVTDTFAYIIGSLIGKRKFIPKVSPNKSIAGLIAGTSMGVFVSVMFYITAFDFNDNILNIVLISLFLSLVGQIGDLLFSFIKRNYNVKDFSNIMPGHGGILDRLDSILFITMAFGFVMHILVL